MARTGKITLYEGVGKASKKPFTALRLEVGKFNKLYFDITPLEREYIEGYLKGTDAPSSSNEDKIDLKNETPVPNQGEGLFAV